MQRSLLCYATFVATAREYVQELLDKWRDVRDTTDDYTEQTVAEEIIMDLHEVHKCLSRT